MLIQFPVVIMHATMPYTDYSSEALR